MVRVFRLDDGSFAVECGDPSHTISNTACAPMTVNKLDQDATFWDDGYFGTSIANEDGLAKFTSTVLTAKYLAARGPEVDAAPVANNGIAYVSRDHDAGPPPNGSGEGS